MDRIVRTSASRRNIPLLRIVLWEEKNATCESLRPLHYRFGSRVDAYSMLSRPREPAESGPPSTGPRIRPSENSCRCAPAARERVQKATSAHRRAADPGARSVKHGDQLCDAGRTGSPASLFRLRYQKPPRRPLGAEDRQLASLHVRTGGVHLHLAERVSHYQPLQRTRRANAPDLRCYLQRRLSPR
jgi:hypothetical protein